MNKSLPLVEIAMEMALPKYFLDQVAKNHGAEKARECAMSTSVGGIGPLLRERIIEQGEQGLNVIGVSLLYESVWVQAWHEWGQINLQKRSVGQELRSCLAPTNFDFDLPLFDGTKVRVEVWSLAYGKSTVYFLAAPEINGVVYPGPKDAPHGTENPFSWSHECRLKQSWLVGRGALILSEKLNRQPAVVVLSETPTIFGHHALVMDDLQKNPFFNSTKYIFNDHTPLEYAHPLWEPHTMELVQLDKTTYLETPAWNAQKNILDVTSLLVSKCDGVFGVARKHGDVMRAMPSLKLWADKIQYITNGVLKEEWQSNEFKSHEALKDAELLEVKKKYKSQLLDWVWRHCQQWPGWAQTSQDRHIVLWTRRITPYKRMDLLVKLLKDADMRRTFLSLNILLFVGGRIHQQDNHAQDIVYELLDLLSRDKEVQNRILVIDNFNVWEAPLLFKGADAAIMLADDTREASATGFMKAQMNGAAILATADGAVPEFVNFYPETYDLSSSIDSSKYNGFNIPYVKGEPTPQGLLNAFIQFDRVISSPKNRLEIMKSALHITEQVSVSRTVRETEKLYEQVLAHEPVKA